MRKHLCAFLIILFFLSFLAAGDITINEIYYTTRTNGNETQWIELFNKSNSEIDISGWKLTVSKNTSNAFIIPAGTILNGEDFLIFAASSDVMSSLWGLNKDIIEYGDALQVQETGDDVHLFNNLNEEIDAVWFGDGGEMGPTNAAHAVSFGMSLARHPDGSDTDNPLHDFSERFPTPENSNSFTGFNQSTWGKIKAIYSIRERLLGL
jgi:hypothetical protein